MNSFPPKHRCALLLVCFIGLLGSGCVAHVHSIGLGATGTNEIVARQYYALFGFIAVNEVDPQRMAADLTSYSIETKFGFVDMLLAPFLLPLTFTTRTVIVRT
ncbi:MAG TPA: hypothetical protein VFD82_05240 [Planctomycetota bacterium]|nr:hypothetical protein [Planctomycetota bacterium]